MQTEQPGALQIGEWQVDPALDVITRGTETHKLEPRTMRLLLCLAAAGGGVVSVDTLLTEVWSGVVVGSASVYQAVSQLRKLLGDINDTPTYIANVPRKGYRLVARVQRLAPSPPAVVEAAPIPPAPPSATPQSAAPWRDHRLLIIAGVLILGVVALGLVAWHRHRLATSGTDEASIVVLPFIDMTADKGDQAFCDGMTEELSSWLAQIPTLHVVARTSAFAFRGKDEDVRAIGKALSTSHVLEGSLRRSGTHARITVQLIDARNGYHLWSDSFDIPIEDAIKVQEDISRSVAHTLQIRLTSDTEQRFATRRTANAEAYQWFLLGRHFAQLSSRESTDLAVEYFQRVVAADPAFAPGYTQLSFALLNQWYFQNTPIDDVARKIEPLIAQALTIDRHFSSAYAVRGALRDSQSRTEDGLADLQTAISLNPNDLGALAEVGRVRLMQGQPLEALRSYDLAVTVDPLNPTLHEQRCTALSDLTRYAEAQRACDQARQLNPGSASPTDHLAALAESQGKLDEALRWSAASLRATSDFDYYWLQSDLFLDLGLAAPARAALERGRETSQNEDVEAALVRVVYCEGGVPALRAYLKKASLDRSEHAKVLFAAAYGALLTGDTAAVNGLVARARSAPDREPGYAEYAWFARGERAEMAPLSLTVAAADLALGDRASADRDLRALTAMLDRMMADGVRRHATYEYRAQAHALLGEGDAAMRDLQTAVRLGWRRVWWARHEPYFASLQQRQDFRALMDDVQRANDALTAKLTPAGSL